MPRGTKLERRAAPRPLLPPELRRPAAVLVTGCVAVTAALALAFAGKARPGGLDAAVDARVRGGLGPYQEQLHQLAGLGGLVPVTVLTIALVLACLATRRWRGAALAGVVVPAAVALTEFVLKPLVGRTIRGYPGFPSGHATALFALAATCAVLLAGPSRPRLPGAVRLPLVFGAALVAAAVGTAMVGLGYHYFTDIVAGTAVGVGMVLLTALLIDWAARSPRAWRPARRPGDSPVTSRRDPRSMTGHLVAGDASSRAAGPAT
jgi:membrane-associated phospholipid phosphatase